MWCVDLLLCGLHFFPSLLLPFFTAGAETLRSGTMHFSRPLRPPDAPEPDIGKCSVGCFTWPQGTLQLWRMIGGLNTPL